MTGLLYFMVIVMWIVILLPLYLKRHDREELERMLAEPLVDQLAQRWETFKPEPITTREQAFIRRRRVLMALLTWLIATALLSATGHVSLYWIIAPLLSTLAFGAAAYANAKNASQRVARTQRPADLPVLREPSADNTQISQTSTGITIPQAPSRTWRPIESPLPSYVTADKATPYPRGIDAEKPWTSADMLAQAAAMRAAQADRIKQAQKRLEEARALAMEKARRAAIAAAEQEAVRRKRAANE